MIARSGVGRKFQVPSVFRELTVRQNLEVAYCKKPGISTNLMRGPQNDDTIGLEDLCVFVDLIDQMEAPAAYLSHGQTQWLEIALADGAGRRADPDGRADRRHDRPGNP